MALQQLTVFALVLVCALYAAWMLMPAVARRFVATRLVVLPLGSRLKKVFQKAALPQSGCDCSGCDKVMERRHQAKTQVVRFHARTKH